MLTKPPFFPAARPINAAKRGYSTDSTTYGIQRGSHRWGGRECTDRFIQSYRPYCLLAALGKFWVLSQTDPDAPYRRLRLRCALAARSSLLVCLCVCLFCEAVDCFFVTSSQLVLRV